MSPARSHDLGCALTFLQNGESNPKAMAHKRVGKILLEIFRWVQWPYDSHHVATMPTRAWEGPILLGR